MTFTVKDAALSKACNEALASFTTKVRTDGQDFVCNVPEAPAWVTETVYQAHDGAIPNDWIYQTSRDVVEGLLSWVGEEGCDLEDAMPEVAESCATDNAYSLRHWAAQNAHLADVGMECLIEQDKEREAAELPPVHRNLDDILSGCMYFVILQLGERWLAAIQKRANEIMGDEVQE